MFVHQLTSNYCEVPTGQVSVSLPVFIQQYDLIVTDVEDGYLYAHAEWGNGEGRDEFLIESDVIVKNTTYHILPEGDK